MAVERDIRWFGKVFPVSHLSQFKMGGQELMKRKFTNTYTSFRKYPHSESAPKNLQTIDFKEQ